MNKKKEKRIYEIVLIFTSMLSEEEINKKFLNYKKYLKKKKINLIKEENWGIKKLFYKIKKNNNGYFYLLEYECKPKFIKKFNIKILQDETIIRHLIVKMNKYAIEYSLKKKKNE